MRSDDCVGPKSEANSPNTYRNMHTVYNLREDIAVINSVHGLPIYIGFLLELINFRITNKMSIYVELD